MHPQNFAYTLRTDISNFHSFSRPNSTEFSVLLSWKWLRITIEPNMDQPSIDTRLLTNIPADCMCKFAELIREYCAYTRNFCNLYYIYIHIYINIYIYVCVMDAAI